MSLTAFRVAPPLVPPVDAVRHFNRFYTRKIGVLSQGLLDTPFSLTEARVLYELAHRPGLTATTLGADLGLDAGYLSRLLARFTQKRLLTRERSRTDARVSALRLTPLGQKTFAALNTRSAAQIAALLTHLPVPGQHHLAAHLRAAERLLTPIGHPPPSVVLRAPRPGDFGWVVQRHGALYAEEYNWDATFESLVARIVADYIDRHDPTREQAWIAEINGDPVGSIFLVRATATTAKLRLLLVEPSARGAGVGRQLLTAAVAFARRAGYKKITLWTNSVLHAARALYAKAGFQLTRSEPHHSFGHPLTSETWELPLT